MDADVLALLLEKHVARTEQIMRPCDLFVCSTDPNSLRTSELINVERRLDVRRLCQTRRGII